MEFRASSEQLGWGKRSCQKKSPPPHSNTLSQQIADIPNSAEDVCKRDNVCVGGGDTVRERIIVSKDPKAAISPCATLCGLELPVWGQVAGSQYLISLGKNLPFLRTGTQDAW